MYNSDSILFVVLGTPEQIPSSRIRAYYFSKYLSENENCTENIKIIRKSINSQLNFIAFLKYFISNIIFFLRLLWIVRHKWKLVCFFQVFLPSWFMRLIARRSCTILDITDFGTFDYSYIKNTSQNTSLFSKLSFWKRIYERKNMLETCENVTCVIANAGKVLPSFMTPFSNKIRTLIDPVDVEKYRPYEEQKPLIIGWVGSPATAYFINSIKSVLVTIKEKYQDEIVFHFFGATSSSFDSEIRNIAKFIPWSIEKDIPETCKIRIGLVPAPNDSLSRYKQPYKILLHMAAGTPIIATPTGMVPYMIKENETGFLAETNDEWLRYLILLINDKILRKRMGQCARKYTVENYSYLEYAKKWKNIICEANAAFEK